jgi:ATP-binding cassette, subfamily A (ABC1), member 3
VKFISPGAKRKLSIAMALIGDAKFIIMDEPTSNLDLKSREKIWFLIKKIAKEKERSILISTQHIEEADFIGTKICIIKEGIKSHCDTPDNLKRKFGHGFKVKMVSDETRH